MSCLLLALKYLKNGKEFLENEPRFRNLVSAWAEGNVAKAKVIVVNDRCFTSRIHTVQFSVSKAANRSVL